LIPTAALSDQYTNTRAEWTIQPIAKAAIKMGRLAAPHHHMGTDLTEESRGTITCSYSRPLAKEPAANAAITVSPMYQVVAWRALMSSGVVHYSRNATRARIPLPEDRRLDGARLRPAVSCGDVIEPTAHLVNPPHRLAVGREQVRMARL